MDESVIEGIVNSSKSKSLTLFIGAGVSRTSGLPSWESLVDKFVEKLGITPPESYSSDELLVIPQKYFNTNEDDYNRIIKSEFQSGKYNPNYVHDQIFALRPASIITTNFDDLLEQAALKSYRTYHVISKESDVSRIEGKPFILKAHGDARTGNFVLKEEDYLRYSDEHSLIETLMKSIFATNTVLFVGYGLNDYNIKLIVNWVKELLKNDYRQPYFLYTDDNELTPIDMLYQKNRGLHVIDYRDYCKEDTGFPDRYTCFFDLILSQISDIQIPTTDKGGFDYLYQQLVALDELEALRYLDIQDKLPRKYFIVDEIGCIRCLPGGNEVFSYYCKLYKTLLSGDTITNPDIEKKFLKIKKVLDKARIHGIEFFSDDIKSNFFEFDTSKYILGDLLTLTNDYAGMEKKLRTSKSNYRAKYKIAYYYMELRKFEEAFRLYSEVASTAFIKKDYVYYQLAQTNCLRIFQTLKGLSHNLFFEQEFKNTLTQETLTRLQALSDEDIYSELPVEYQKEYPSLSRLFRKEHLYENMILATQTLDKVNRVVRSYTSEAGISSGGKAASFINQHLHFCTGNALYVDDMPEFVAAMRTNQIAVMEKYAHENKTILRKELMIFGRAPFSLDRIDFYCLIEYITPKDFLDMVNRLELKQIQFNNPEEIERIICNFMDYYATKYLDPKEYTYAQNYFDDRLKRLITVSRFIKLTTRTVEKICSVLFAKEFSDIRIDDKFLFVGRQIHEFKSFSTKIRKAVSETLLRYIEQNASERKKGKRLELPSTRSNVNYYSLAYCLSLPDKRYISPVLSEVIDNQINDLCVKDLEIVFEYYYPRLTRAVKSKVLAKGHEVLLVSFTFGLFEDLVHRDPKALSDEELVLAINHVRSIIPRIKSEQAGKVRSQPPADSQLVTFAAWCLLGYIPKKAFDEFVGISKRGDFLISPATFDYNCFECSWIIDLSPRIHLQIAKNEYAKQCVKVAVQKYLDENVILDIEQKALTSILLKYYV